ncbi:MAG: YqaA family protein [Chloroflexota bacterium]|jgi:membrane protein YqaA with SNARE-associated domain|nr:YqaA family protein [Chloroflexota bacterium]MDP6507657.1 YqaA family protein [Chloroflexota bacterium]MDP6757338.1 YqaA family protein [Chloroflexota bacterium]|tara:strand:- start:238 stop:822 length:585 start_codon:yes stop_codon:yes gene_type:complete
MEAWADSPYGGIALFVLAFFESSFFPLPPDPLMILLAVANVPFALGFAAITTAGSLLGAVLGYYIGLRGGRPILDKFFSQEKILFVERQYQQRDVWAVAIAGFTPIPYKVFAIGAGAFRLDFRRFMLASLLGRAGRFFLVGLLITIFGEPIQQAIDDYLDILALAFVVLLVIGFIIIRIFVKPEPDADSPPSAS